MPWSEVKETNVSNGHQFCTSAVKIIYFFFQGEIDSDQENAKDSAFQQGTKIMGFWLEQKQIIKSWQATAWLVQPQNR